MEATKEIGLAVLATTLSLVAIFVPVGFMSGMVGRFMQSFGLTMAFAIIVSLLVSFTLTPMMSARWLRVKRAGPGGAAHDSKHSAIFGPMDRAYTAMLELVDGAPMGDRRPRRGRAPVERAALQVRRRHLRDAGRSVGVRRERARASRAPASRRRK